MVNTIKNSTPLQDGFRMPGEFEKHAGTWMMWPERSDNWRNGAKPAQQAFAEVAAAIAKFEPLTMLVSAAQFQNARNMLPETVRIVEMSYNDSWARDIGPTFVIDGKGEVRLVDWDFNAWGGLFDGLYFPWDQDQLVARKIAEIEGITRYDAGHFVLEGGSIHVDGEGTVITTEECLLSQGRNPEMSQEEIEENLRQYLGVEKVIWLGRGIDPEETNGHVDDVCAFVKPGVLLVHWTDDPQHPHYDICHDAWERLSAATDARGRKFELHKLLAPPPLHITAEESQGVDVVEGTAPRQEGVEMAATYVNFYLPNGAVILPGFGVETDALAVETFKRVFPQREIVQIKGGREIVLGGGNVHCITQQQPAG